MIINSLKLANYRNYTDAVVNSFSKFNLFLGKNGSGKTNLLDAIHYACLGKSYISSTDRLVLRWEADFFRVETLITNSTKKYKVVDKVIPGKSKEITINGKALNKISEIIGQFPCIAIAPKEIFILLQTSEERRKLMDKVLVQFNKKYLQALIQYNQLLKRRNALLKQTERVDRIDLSLIAIFNKGLVEQAEIIYKTRSEFFTSLAPKFQTLYEEISSRQEVCSIHYKSELEKKSLLSLLEVNLEKDILLNRTTSGIHKDDLVFKIEDTKLNAYGSQGQLKSFIIALKLALYACLKDHTERLPILLLDDIFDKFDNFRIASLVKILNTEDYGQIFITDANTERLPIIISIKEIDYKTFYIHEGKISDEITE